MNRSKESVVVHPAVAVTAGYTWRLLVIGLGLAALAWLIGTMWITFLSLFLALLLWRALDPIVGWLRSHRWPDGAAAIATLLGFLLVTLAIFVLVGVQVGNQAGQIGSTLSDGIDEVQRWVVEDSSFDVDDDDVIRFRTNIEDAATDWLQSSRDTVVSGVIVTGQLLLGILVALIVTFFALKDGGRFTRWTQSLLPEDRQENAERLARRAWTTIGGYLKGAALLGILEGVVIGITVVLAGGDLALAIGLFTFTMAFIPFIGAWVSGIVAVLITLATGGPVAALVVMVVVLIVQQFDQNLLAPVIYGTALDMHPVVVLLSVTAGGALFGAAGGALAVPVVAVTIAIGSEALRIRRETVEAIPELVV